MEVPPSATINLFLLCGKGMAMMRLSAPYGWSILLATAWICAGCDSKPANSSATSTVNDPTTASPAADAKEATVVVQLNWHPEAEHGGYYAALVHGYYAEEGLNVTIEPGGPQVMAISNVALERAAFAVDNADKLVAFRGQMSDVVAVFAPIQDSPRCIMVHEESGMTKLEDLQYVKKLTLAWNATQPFAEVLQKKLDLSHLQFTKYSGSVGPFLLNKASAQQAYSISEPFLAREQGAKPVCLMMSEVGYNPYTSLLVATRKTLIEQPELVRKMVRASQRGWQKYLAEPEDTNRHIADLNPQMPVGILDFGASELKKLCRPGDLPEDQIGQMNLDRWKAMIDQLWDIGIPAPERRVRLVLQPEEAFTTEFLPVSSAKPAEPTKEAQP
jgi:NitT/TauT family transport system substrate-binding protein